MDTRSLKENDSKEHENQELLEKFLVATKNYTNTISWLIKKNVFKNIGFHCPEAVICDAITLLYDFGELEKILIEAGVNLDGYYKFLQKRDDLA